MTTPNEVFAIPPPIEPMLAKVAATLPRQAGLMYEPKWDGFRAIVFRGADDIYIQSRDLKPLDRYFPELHDELLARLPPGCVVDGEIVIVGRQGLDFDSLQLRLHPAASRVAKLAKEIPSSFVAFDLLAANGVSLTDATQAERRARLESLWADARAPLHLTPMTRSPEIAEVWLKEFEGAGLDGVIVKSPDARYQPGKRVMIKVKHIRTADCVVAGFRWHKASAGRGTAEAAGERTGHDIIGSLLLGLFDDEGTLHHVGVTSAFTMDVRKKLAMELEPLRRDAMNGHPWREWAEADAHPTMRMPGAQSRWTGGKDLSWEPLRIERVCEVKYDHMQGDRFRHAAIFLRWRPDKPAEACRYDQLEVTPPYALKKVFGA